MKQTAIVIAPGRGTYNKAELGYLATRHPDFGLLADFDAYRQAEGQTPVSALDGAERYSSAIHTGGDNASPLIYACGLADFGAIDRQKYDILGVTGNSMGWYTALGCVGALAPLDGFRVANTMGTLMQTHMIGGQLIYPFVDEDWREIPGRRTALLTQVDAINTRPDHILDISIALGGMLVLAGNDAGLTAFENEVPKIQDRFPMRLKNHAGFHTSLQAPVSKRGFEALPASLFQQPDIPLIDGRGGIWHPKSSDLDALYRYTLGHQVTETYDFTAALRSAAHEFMPDVFLILGPGTTLGGACAQALIQCGWRGWQEKSDVPKPGEVPARLISLGAAEPNT